MATNGPMFQGNAPSIQGVQSNTAQVWGSLASRLKAFNASEEDRLDQLMAKKMKEQGRIDQQGKTEITLRNGETIADNAWNEGAKASYTAAVQLDLTENMGRLEAAHKLDPTGYAENAKALVSGLVSSADPSIQPYVEDLGAEMILAGGTRITSAVNTIELGNQNALVERGIKLNRDLSANLAMDGDEIRSMVAQNAALEYISSQVSSGAKKPEVALKEITEIELERNFASDKYKFSKAMENGTVNSFLKKTRNSNKYSPDETEQLEKEMMGMLTAEVSRVGAQDKLDAAAYEASWAEGEQAVAQLHLSGELTEKILYDMVANDELDPAIGKAYSSLAGRKGPINSDFTQKLWVSQNLLDLSITQIVSNDRISDEDKLALIGERDALLKDKGNWRNSSGAREGYERINNILKFNPNSIMPPTDEQYRLAGMKRADFHNQVQRLAPSDRTHDNIVAIANEVIADQVVKGNLKTIEENHKTIAGYKAKLSKIDPDAKFKRAPYEERIKSLQDEIEALSE